MHIKPSHIETFLFDSTLNNFIQDLILLEDNFGINYIPSPIDDRSLLSQLQQAWTNISKRIRKNHPHAHHFLIEYTDIFDKVDFAPTFLASTRILSSKIDHLNYIKIIFSNALVLANSSCSNNLPVHPTTQFSPRITDNIHSLSATLFSLITTNTLKLE